VRFFHSLCTGGRSHSATPSREALYESEELSKEARDSAALLASKVYYFLGEYDEALSFALGAGNAFEAEARSHGSEEYVETLVCEFPVIAGGYVSMSRPSLPSQGHRSLRPTTRPRATGTAEG
jgi:hypothetical protein